MGEAARTAGVGGGRVMGSLGSDNDAGWKDGAATFNISLIVGGNRVGEWVSSNMTHKERTKTKKKWRKITLVFVLFSI